MTSPKPDSPKGAPATGPLYAALATARERCKPAEKSSKNEHHRYKYASAEAILETANEALHGTGLSVTPLSQTIARRECGDVLVCTFRLACGGEVVDAVKEWPVVPGNGRPMDKAVASADTTALGYFLRDLLLMPRVDETDDMDHPSRDQQRPGKTPPPKRPSGPPKNQQGGGQAVGASAARMGDAPAASQPSPPAPQAGPSPEVEAAARRLGVSGREAIEGRPDAQALYNDAARWLPSSHKALAKWNAQFLVGPSRTTPTRDQAIRFIGAIAADIEAKAAERAKATMAPLPMQGEQASEIEAQILSGEFSPAVERDG